MVTCYGRYLYFATICDDDVWSAMPFGEAFHWFTFAFILVADVMVFRYYLFICLVERIMFQTTTELQQGFIRGESITEANGVMLKYSTSCN
jgi:hypothetical protein